MSAAVNCIRFGFLDVRDDDTAKRISDQDEEEVRALMHEWAPKARVLFGLFRAAKRTSAIRVLYTGPVIGVALITFRYQPRACSAAWGAHYEGRSLAKMRTASKNLSRLPACPYASRVPLGLTRLGCYNGPCTPMNNGE